MVDGMQGLLFLALILGVYFVVKDAEMYGLGTVALDRDFGQVSVTDVEIGPPPRTASIDCLSLDSWTSDWKTG